jgi:hypothetical protein
MTTAAVCVDEQTTQHYRRSGYGPVKNEEQVIVAVFDEMDRDDGRLSPTAFKPKELTRDEFSLARVVHITNSEFTSRVVEPQSAIRGSFIGVVRAEVRALREIQFSFRSVDYRAVCVTDKVTQYDYDAHAALGYSENQEALVKPKDKKIVRATIHADLADRFGNIINLDEVFTPSDR